MKSEKSRWQFSRAHHGRKYDFAPVINAPAGDWDLFEFGRHDASENATSKGHGMDED